MRGSRAFIVGLTMTLNRISLQLLTFLPTHPLSPTQPHLDDNIQTLPTSTSRRNPPYYGATCKSCCHYFAYALPASPAQPSPATIPSAEAGVTKLLR